MFARLSLNAEEEEERRRNQIEVQRNHLYPDVRAKKEPAPEDGGMRRIGFKHATPVIFPPETGFVTHEFGKRPEDNSRSTSGAGFTGRDSHPQLVPLGPSSNLDREGNARPQLKQLRPNSILDRESGQDRNGYESKAEEERRTQPEMRKPVFFDHSQEDDARDGKRNRDGTRVSAHNELESPYRASFQESKFKFTSETNSKASDPRNNPSQTQNNANPYLKQEIIPQSNQSSGQGYQIDLPDYLPDLASGRAFAQGTGATIPGSTFGSNNNQNNQNNPSGHYTSQSIHAGSQQSNQGSQQSNQGSQDGQNVQGSYRSQRTSPLQQDSDAPPGMTRLATNIPKSDAKRSLSVTMIFPTIPAIFSFTLFVCPLFHPLAPSPFCPFPRFKIYLLKCSELKVT